MLTRTDEIIARSQLEVTIPEGFEVTNGYRAQAFLRAAQVAIAIKTIAPNGLPITTAGQNLTGN